MRIPARVARHRVAPAIAAAVGLLSAAAVAVPAAGAAGAAGSAGAGRPSTSATATAAATAAATATKSTKRPRTTSPRPHCTGCVEHQVFGFEDGTDQRWRPYGSAATELAGTRVTRTASTLGAPRTGAQMLVVSGVGHAGGLRWPATTDAWLSGSQVRVWVRPHSRAGTLRLAVNDASGAGVAMTALVTPGIWTPITTPRWKGDRSALTVSLTQVDACTDGAVGAFDLDDTAIASSFTPEPAIWRSDDSSLLAPALLQVTLTQTPCPSTTSTALSVLDFEDGTTQGWQPVGKAALRVADAKALAGARTLEVRGLSSTSAAARLVTPVSAWGGRGDWYRMVLLAAGTQTSTTSVSRAPTCAPSPTVKRLGATLRFSVTGATRVVGERRSVERSGSVIEVYFQLAQGVDTVTVDVAGTSSKLGPVLLDNVVLGHGEPSDLALSGSASAGPASSGPASSGVASYGSASSGTTVELEPAGSGGQDQPACGSTSGKTTF